MKFFPAHLLTQAKDPGEGHPMIGTQNYSLQQQGFPLHQQEPRMVDPKRATDLTFSACLPVSTDLCPTFSLHKPESIFSTLETVVEKLVHYLPGTGFTEINPFSCVTTTCLTTFVVSGQSWSLLGSPEPGALLPLSPGYMNTSPVVSSDLSRGPSPAHPTPL